MKLKLQKTIYMLSRYFLYAFLLQMVFINLASAVDVLAQYKRIDEVLIKLDRKNLTLDQFFKQIEAKSDFLFAYDKQDIDRDFSVTMDQKKASVEDYLKQVARQASLTFRQVNNSIDIKKIERPVIAEKPIVDVTISGTVTDEKGEAIPGVTVSVSGTGIGTATDLDGKYSLTVPEGATLVFSFIGFQTQSIVVGDRSVINVTLLEDMASLDEVVVVGYGEQKKVSLTSAVSQVEGEDLSRRPISNLGQAFQGQVPGLTIIDQGGGPGKAAATARIRGITTLSGNNNPLIIVDGIEQRFSDINPSDIESVSVLKDASSTAIYGSRAANGVILITTKRAKSGKVAVFYNGFYAVQKANNNPEHMGLEDYMRMQNVAYQNVGSEAIYTEPQIQEYVNATDRYKYPLPYAMAEAILRPAPQVNHSLSVSGGNENFKARLSLRYQDQGGIIPNSESQLNEVRVNTDFKVSPKINLSTDVNYRYVNSLAPVEEHKMFERFKHGSLWTVPKYPDGTYGISAQGQNALIYAEIAGTSKTANDFIIGNIKGDWEILKGLTFTTQFAVRMDLETIKNFANSYIINDYYDPTIVRKTEPLNRLTEIRNNNREITLNNLLNYSITLGDNSINVLAGYSEIENKGSTLNAYRQGFYNNDIQSIGQGANDNTKDNDGNEYQWGLRSFFGRFNYSYQDKYLFEANGRYDGSSRFTGANRYSFFPSFSTGWRISEEQFWGNLGNIINEFKLRGSWGKTGNQAVALYTYFPTLNLVDYSFDGVPVQGYLQQQMTNEDITWETTTQSNVGLDAQFLNNRISFSVDYYNKRTDGILLILPVPGALGLRATAQNAGMVGNYGWEFSVGSRNNFGELGFDANLNFSANNNNVISLAGTGPYITGSLTEVRSITGEGYPISSLWGYKTDGLFQTEEEVLNHTTIGSGIKPGDVKYLDLNNDGIINADDQAYLGNNFPKYTFGSTFNLTYKGFALNLLFQGAAGVKTSFGGALSHLGNLEGFTHKILTNNYWTLENPNARFPRPTKFDLRNIYQSDRKMIDASYLRLKNIQLVYLIPSSLTKKASIEQMSIYVSGTNLLTFSRLNEWNLDPESSPGRVENYPQTTLYTLGVNLQF
ncbi:MAG: TonB-dependent receptor [Anditalea sp.]